MQISVIPGDGTLFARPGRRGKPLCVTMVDAAQAEALHVGPKAHVFVLTGAGVSADSGLKTFRDAGGLWERERVEDVATPEAWTRDPARVWRFYSARRAQAAQAQPNAAHRALARMGQALGSRLFLCTQNVDDLHERAGSAAVHHMHGMLAQSRCARATSADEGLSFACPAGRAGPEPDAQLYASLDEVPRCSCGGRLRPHICWFGEVPFGMTRILAALRQAQYFLVVGSSGSVYPAAGLVGLARQQQPPAHTLYIGPEAPDNADAFDTILLGGAAAAVPRLWPE